MKFVYIRLTCCVSVLSKRLNLLKLLLFIVFLRCAEYGLETFVASSVEIRLMAFYLKPNCIHVSLETLLLSSDEIRIITKDLQLNCAEYGLQTRITSTENSSVLTLHIVNLWWIRLGTMSHPKWCHLCIVIRHTSYLSVYGSKVNLHKIWRATCDGRIYDFDIHP
jgi:hypothetical protein